MQRPATRFGAILSDPVARLRAVGLVEGTTLLLLVGVAVPLKRLAGWPEGVSVMGPAHGLMFLLYGVAVVDAVAGGGWRGREVARLALACLVPFGTFLNDGWLRRRAVGPSGTASARLNDAPAEAGGCTSG